MAANHNDTDESAIEVFLYDNRRYREWFPVKQFCRLLLMSLLIIISVFPKRKRSFTNKQVFILEQNRQKYIDYIPNDADTLILTDRISVYVKYKGRRKNDILLSQTLMYNRFVDIIHIFYTIYINPTSRNFKFIEFLALCLLHANRNIFDRNHWSALKSATSFSDKNLLAAGCCTSKLYFLSTVIQHGTPGELYFPVLARRALVWSEYFKDFYQSNGTTQVKVIGFPFPLGTQCPIQLNNSCFLYVQTKFSTEQESSNINILYEFFSKSTKSLDIKLRPNPSSKDKSKYKRLSMLPNVHIISELDFTKEYRLTITHCSGLWYEMAYFGVPPIFLSYERNKDAIPHYSNELKVADGLSTFSRNMSEFTDDLKYLEYRTVSRELSFRILGI